MIIKYTGMVQKLQNLNQEKLSNPQIKLHTDELIVKDYYIKLKSAIENWIEDLKRSI